jgi:hypothetical protein
MTAPHSLDCGDSAYGQRTRPGHFHIAGRFATGMRAAPTAAIPRHHYAYEQSPVAITV